jgi:hypothetical protein
VECGLVPGDDDARAHDQRGAALEVRVELVESESPLLTTYFLLDPALVDLAVGVGVAVPESPITPELTTMPTRAITATRNTTGTAMRAAMRVERDPAGRGRGALDVFLDEPMGRWERGGGGVPKESMTGAGGNGPRSAGGSAAVPGVPMDSSRRRAASGSSTPPAGVEVRGVPSGVTGRGRRVLLLGVSSLIGNPGGRCA